MATMLVLAAILACSPAGAEQGRGESATPPESRALLLELAPDKTRAYLHQPVSVTVTLLSDSVTVRNLEYPRLGASSFTPGEFSPPRRRSEIREGREWMAWDFTATLTPKESGTLQLGPAQLRCDTLAPAGGSAAFFGATEASSVTLNSAPHPVTVLPLPLKGRPADFSGAVGDFAVTRTLQPVSVPVGEPVTLRTVIRGTGYLDPVSCPSLQAPGLRPYPPRALRGSGSLSCEQVLIPEAAVDQIPPLELHFFDPEQGRYRTASSKALPLRVSLQAAAAVASVSPPAPAASPATPPVPPATKPSLSSSGAAGPLSIAAVLLIATGAALFLRARLRAHAAPVPAAEPALPAVPACDLLQQTEAALAAEDVEAFYLALFRAVQGALSQRLSRVPEGIAAPRPGEELQDAGAGQAKRLLCRCDLVRYGMHRPKAEEMSRDLAQLRELLERSPSQT